MRRLRKDRRGATAVEFALVAPVFLMFLFLLLEGGAMIWTKQALGEVAFSTARCSALKLADCANETKAKAYAVARGGKVQVKVAAADVTVENAATCGNVAGMRRVTVTKPWTSAAGKLFPKVPTSISASSCFPVIA